ncbi:hypothetical protein COT42_02360 [Candidatus Saganbacteria bacterium CG08_land_8_20_14_0_20_45_16]|uniref:Uncharacterized protein n=1 Tax=Candidatus Saganbacteria bacterium CG08_land_8_20_14_0_20_45_16 TaxID=2014293 RepID=A0A2H0Y077_UNCSA|nr:MAG: hypothetical protein COT42_02360 [Candidatus Saganbacteria bacterium CG08_land_8_20_14_0_20_45_16]
MDSDNSNKIFNSLELDGLIFTTNGNISFTGIEENPFYLAQSPLLKNMDGLLEDGMSHLLKKLKG